MAPQERADRREELLQEAYDALFDEIRAADEAAYEDEFGAEFRAMHPFKPDNLSIHRRVMARLTTQD